MKTTRLCLGSLLVTTAFLAACASPAREAEYFQLRPEVEKAYGYTHAVRIPGLQDGFDHFQQ